MISITPQQANKRWDALTPRLREALFADTNDDIIRKLCIDEHIPEDKQDNVFGATSCVLMGFLHPEDLAKEINSATSLNIQIANTLAAAINQRIFNPLREDIDKVYSPANYNSASTLTISSGPKIIQDVGAPTNGSANFSLQTSSAPARLDLTSLPTNQAKPAAPPKPPASSLGGPGWSRATPSEPVVKLNQISVPPPEAPISGSVIRSGAGSTGNGSEKPPMNFPAASGPLGEFERRAMQSATQKGIPKPPGNAPMGRIAPQASVPATAKPAAPTGPAPVMLHEVSSFAPSPKASDFHLQLPEQKIDMSKAQSVVSQKPAVSEFGSMKPAVPAQSGPLSTPRSRVVHYSEYKSPSPETPVTHAAQGPREVTEITSAAPTAPPPSPSLTPFAQPLPLSPSAQKPAVPAGTPKPMPTPPTPPASPLPKPFMAPPPPKPPMPPMNNVPKPPAPPQNQNKVNRVDYSA